MKKHGILNRDIARILAGMGHTDCIVIADCGLPIPTGVECIDLALKIGSPSFSETLAVILADFQCERAAFASEALERNAAVVRESEAMAAGGIATSYVPHEDFKKLTAGARAIIRTGEASPYANVVLYSGVIF